MVENPRNKTTHHIRRHSVARPGRVPGRAAHAMIWKQQRRPSHLSLRRRESGRKEGRPAQPAGTDTQTSHPSSVWPCSQLPLEAKGRPVRTRTETAQSWESPQGSRLPGVEVYTSQCRGQLGDSPISNGHVAFEMMPCSLQTFPSLSKDKEKPTN